LEVRDITGKNGIWNRITGKGSKNLKEFTGDVLYQDGKYLEKINYNNGIRKVTLTDETGKGVSQLFKDDKFLKEIKLNPGEAVFFKDRRLLHGRNSFIGDRQLNKGAIASSIPESIIKLLQ
jgi:hypothetical protein